MQFFVIGPLTSLKLSHKQNIPCWVVNDNSLITYMPFKTKMKELLNNNKKTKERRTSQRSKPFSFNNKMNIVSV